MFEGSYLSETMFQKEYIESTLESSDEYFEFEYSRNGMYFLNRTVKRLIEPSSFDVEKKLYYDLETPLGYGGLYVNTTDPRFLLEAFHYYRNYCKQKNIIAEFIRFNPLYLQNSEVISNLDFHSLDRLTVNIDLQPDFSEIQRKFSQSVRNTLRRQSAVEFSQEIEPEDFYDLYRETMDRNNAASRHRYNLNFFKKLHLQSDSKFFGAIHANHLISAAIVIVSNEHAYYHLAGNRYSSEVKNGNLELINYICSDLKKSKPAINLLHLGGGRSTAADDSLLKFKAKFSKLTSQYYVGGIIFNKPVYDFLMRNTLLSKKSQKFLGYRGAAL